MVNYFEKKEYLNFINTWGIDMELENKLTLIEDFGTLYKLVNYFGLEIKVPTCHNYLYMIETGENEGQIFATTEKPIFNLDDWFPRNKADCLAKVKLNGIDI